MSYHHHPSFLIERALHASFAPAFFLADFLIPGTLSLLFLVLVILLGIAMFNARDSVRPPVLCFGVAAILMEALSAPVTFGGHVLHLSLFAFIALMATIVWYMEKMCRIRDEIWKQKRFWKRFATTVWWFIPMAFQVLAIQLSLTTQIPEMVLMGGIILIWIHSLLERVEIVRFA